MWRVDLKPTKDGYPAYTFCTKTLEAQQDWLHKLSRHCTPRQPKSPKGSKRDRKQPKQPGSPKIRMTASTDDDE